MRQTVRNVTHRILPSHGLKTIALAGLGSALGIGILGWLSSLTDFKFLFAPFGASAVLLFVLPAGPLSQPVNVVVGHLLCAVIGLAVAWISPENHFSAGIAVGISIATMMAARITHPPAGAMTLVATSAVSDKPLFIASVLAGSVLLVAAAMLWHRLTGTNYPLRPAGS